MNCKTVLGLFIVSFISGNVVADQYVINTLADALLEAASEYLTASGLTTYNVPDFERDFKEGFLKGGFRATRGVLSDFSTLHRTDDATLDLEDKAVTINLSMGLETMSLFFEHCRAWVGALSTSEKLSISVNQNSIEAAISLVVQDDENCQVMVKDVSVTQFGDLEFDLKSLSIIKPVANEIADWIVSYFEDTIQNSVEDSLRNVLEKELENFNWCSLI